MPTLVLRKLLFNLNFLQTKFPENAQHESLNHFSIVLSFVRVTFYLERWFRKNSNFFVEISRAIKTDLKSYINVDLWLIQFPGRGARFKPAGIRSLLVVHCESQKHWYHVLSKLSCALWVKTKTLIIVTVFKNFFWTYSISTVFLMSPIQIVCCYISDYYLKMAVAPGRVKFICPH